MAYVTSTVYEMPITRYVSGNPYQLDKEFLVTRAVGPVYVEKSNSEKITMYTECGVNPSVFLGQRGMPFKEAIL